MDYEAILFDFDYTLGDATAAIYGGFTYAFEQLRLPRPELEAVRRTIGHTLEDSFTLLTGDGDPHRRSAFRRLFLASAEDTEAEKTRLFPGASGLLRALHRHGVKLGIVTTKGSAVLGQVLERNGLTALIGQTVGGEMVSRPKPDPEGLNAAIAALGADKERSLYCGDTIIDAATAQNAGVAFSAVLNGATPAQAFHAYPHVHIAPDLEELRAWLGV